MNKSESVSIYTLSDPLTNEVRYVGWTKEPLQIRLAYHIISTRRRMLGMTSDWISDLINQDKAPVITRVATVKWEDRYDAEKQVIERMVNQGYRLLNRAHNKERKSRA